MQSLRRLALLALLTAPPVVAQEPYRIELILFRQAAPLEASQRAPHDWAHAAPRLEAAARRAPALDELATRLDASDGYRVLLHETWRQRLDDQSVRLSLAQGQSHFEHFPLQGTLVLRQGRWLEVDARFWVNRFGEYGQLLASEQLRQKVRLRPGELRYIDHNSLGLLIKASR
ncbi:peptidoglycan binding protein CsiV [Stutzerimonas stutzeri]|uniref:peptidoglycan binding protein CsiV n=1 Tax=Stutzerimonas sp. S1 TaxID=3030652 RepID=UPI0022251B49|nr:peptidoglycan binding protein CsiV [Stutzerimonas sp. S1]MCW3150233.1 peptidoglycan binding protein CsiV [Stutzerimonas sp. S1]